MANAQTVGLTYHLILSAVHTITGQFISGSDDTLTTAVSGEGSSTYTASTTVPVTKVASGTKALSSGTATLDLTALPGITADETITFSGLKVQFVFLRNLSTNANKISITKGASNGYCFDAGETTQTIILDPGACCFFRIPDSAPDVGSGKKTLDLAGTGAQVLEYILIAG